MLHVQVLHPDAHWSGSLERVAVTESDTERRDREGVHLEGSPNLAGGVPCAVAG